MASNEFRRRADAVRSIPLETVLTRWGANRDPRDKSQWRTERGPLSVTGSQFFNWHLHEGSGGAIDLVIHLSGWGVGAAVEWLEQQLGCELAAPLETSTCAPPSSPASCPGPRPRGLRLPSAHLTNLPRVRRYLSERRCLAPRILEPLLDAGKVYADRRGNAVFLMVAGKVNRSIGAELRGTGKYVWRGLAPGTRKDAGYFWVGAGGSEKIIICESAIDAISCYQLHSASICVSTAGVRPDPPWLHSILARDFDIYCGFDDDATGNRAASQMIARHPSIQRLRPPAHDWNDGLRTSR